MPSTLVTPIKHTFVFNALSQFEGWDSDELVSMNDRYNATCRIMENVHLPKYVDETAKVTVWRHGTNGIIIEGEE